MVFISMKQSLATLTLNSSWLAQMLSDDDKYNKKETESYFFLIMIV